MRFVSVVMIAMALAASAAMAESEPSLKEDAEQVGRAIKNGAEDVYDKSKDATLHGVGTAVDKTGEGLNKAGEKVEGAGEKVKEKAE